MPPKRTAAATPATAAARAKRAKRANTATAPKTAPPKPAKRERWSSVSGSKNADLNLKEIAKNPDKFSFICTCPPAIASGSIGSSDNGGDDDNEDEQSGGSDDSCGRPGCKCGKPMNEYPDHPWIITKGGYQKFLTVLSLVKLRDPEIFHMYTYNDHAGYGVLEVVENLLLDYAEAEDSWKDQWVVCEATVQLLLHKVSSPMLGVDDGERVTATIQLVGVMFLSMLARLEREKLLAEGSEAKDLGVVMATYIKLAAYVRIYSCLDGKHGYAEPPRVKGVAKYNFSRFDDYILAYADKFGITMEGPREIESLLSQCESFVTLPLGTDGNNDPWGWKAALKRHKADHSRPKLGGDQLDITTWPKAKREKASFNGKDPLGEKDLDAIKKGKVMQFS